MSVEVFRARDAASALKQVEQVLGMDAFILSIEAAGLDVMVRASGTRPQVEPKAFKLDVPHEPVPEMVPLPNFLDPEHPKPFEEAELSPSGEPFAIPVHSDFDTLAAPTPPEQPRIIQTSEVRARIAEAKVVVLVTVEKHAFFGVTFELLQEFPNARILTQHEQMDLPWLDASETKTDADTQPNASIADPGNIGAKAPTAIVMCQASSARFDHIVQASLDQPDVAFLVVLPIDADLSPIAGLKNRMAGVIVTGDTALPAAEKRDRLTDFGLHPLWSHHEGVLHPLFEDEAEPVFSKLRFSSRRPRPSAFAA